MKKDIYIITGVSRGIGEAITRKLIKPGNILFCASRSLNEDLVDLASSLSVPLYYSEVDLTEVSACSLLIGDVFNRCDPGIINRIALINNAAMLEPVSRIEDLDVEAMQAHIALNLLTPAILISGFIRNTLGWNMPKVILNISSGASTIPYSGWSMYCSTKAALDMLTRTTGLEQSGKDYPVKTFALAPGIVETAMQSFIRSLDENQFAEKEFFVKLKTEGKLLSASDVAEIIVRSLFHPGIPQGGLLSLSQLKEFNITD